jgi:hypothetical protein
MMSTSQDEVEGGIKVGPFKTTKHRIRRPRPATALQAREIAKECDGRKHSSCAASTIEGLFGSAAKQAEEARAVAKSRKTQTNAGNDRMCMTRGLNGCGCAAYS